MNAEKRIAQLFGLQSENWNRHANPWSFWTRFATLPFLILAIWSRVWFGWVSLVFIVILLIWLWINPVLFKKQKNIDSWASRAVSGEKYWTERKDNPVPGHHHTAIMVLTLLQSIGGILLGIGLLKLTLHFVVLGTITIYFSKMWFLDRMVWIFEDMTRNERV